MTAKHVLWYSLGGHPCEMTKHHEDNKGSLFYLACPLHSLSLTCVSFRDWRDLIEDRVVQCWSKQTIHGRDGIIVKNITYLIGRSSKWQTDVFLQKRGKIRFGFPRRVLNVRIIKVAAIWWAVCPVWLNYIFAGRYTDLALGFWNPD